MHTARVPYLGPVYLHFLNRELRRSVGRTAYPLRCPALIFATAATAGTLFAPLSALIEDYDRISPAEREILRALVTSGQLHLVSDATSLAEFIDERRRLYRFDATRYDRYFHDLTLPSWLEPVVYKSESATSAIEQSLLLSLSKTEPTLLGSLPAVRARAIEKTVHQRRDRGITMSLFSADDRWPVGRFISGTYVNHYTSFLAADIITGLPGLQYFDRFAHRFPGIDFQLMSILFACIGAGSLIGGATLDRLSRTRLVHSLIALRGNQLHTSFVASAQILLADLLTGLRGQNEWFIRGAMEASIRGATVHQMTSAPSVGPAGAEDTLTAGLERVESLRRRMSTPMVHEEAPREGQRELGSQQPDASGPVVFISYMREDSERVDMLCEQLKAAGLPVWSDRFDLQPGERWRVGIRRMITRRACAFVACFSRNYLTREASFMHEELTLALDEIRRRPHDRSWFIPVRFDDVPVPDRDIGGGETLSGIHQVDLFADWSGSSDTLITVLRGLLRQVNERS